MPKTGTYVGGHHHRPGWKRQPSEEDLRMTQSSWTSPVTKPVQIKIKTFPTALLGRPAGDWGRARTARHRGMASLTCSCGTLRLLSSLWRSEVCAFHMQLSFSSAVSLVEPTMGEAHKQVEVCLGRVMCPHILSTRADIKRQKTNRTSKPGVLGK